MVTFLKKNGSITLPFRNIYKGMINNGCIYERQVQKNRTAVR